MITKILEYKESLEEIRLSCAGLAQIKINDKYLLMLNKSSLKRGEHIYTPIGGGIEYLDGAKEFLNTITLKFERSTPDLRLFIIKQDLNRFKDWFYKRIQREITINRELIEELVDETNILNDLSINDINSKYINTIEDIEEYNDIVNYRYFEIFNVSFNNETLKILNDHMRNNNLLYLATKDEILNTKTITNIKIGSNCKAVL